MERHRIHVAWSPVWSFHNQWWIGLPCQPYRWQPYHPAAQDRLPTEAKQGWSWSVPGWETRLLLEEVLVRPAGGAHPVVCVGHNAPVYWQGHYTVNKHRLSGEKLNRGPDSLWSLNVVLAKFPPLARVNHGLPIIPIHLIGSMTFSSLHLYLVCGERTGTVVLWQSDAAHWWWLRRAPPPHDCKSLWVYSNTQ